MTVLDIYQKKKQKENEGGDSSLSPLDRYRASKAEEVGKQVEERVNTWLKNSKNFLYNYNNRVSTRKEGNYIADTEDWLTTISEQKGRFDLEADNIRSILDTYGKFFNEEWVDSVRGILDENGKMQAAIFDASTADHEYWTTTWSGAEEYEKAWDSYTYGTKYEGKTYADIQKALAGTSGREHTWLSENADSFMSSADAQAEIDRLKAEMEEEAEDKSVLDHVKDFVGSFFVDAETGEGNDVQKYRDRIAELEGIRDTAKRTEQVERYNEYKSDPMFSSKAAKGAAYTNPSVGELNAYHVYLERAISTGDQEKYEELVENPVKVKNKVHFYFDNPGMDSAVWAGNPAAAYEHDKIIHDGLQKRWDALTEEEIQMYDYLVYVDGETGSQLADQYLEDIQWVIDKRDTDAMNDTINKAIAEGGFWTNVGMSIASVPANIIGGVTSFLDNTVHKIKGESINPYSPAQSFRHFANTVRSEVGAEIADTVTWELFGQNVMQNLYQAVMSSADSVVGGKVMGRAFSFVMGSGAAANRAAELYEQGASDSQIFWGSLAAGAAEAVFEKVSLDRLLKEKNPASLGQYVLEVLKQAGVEGSEEVATELANLISDGILRGSQSDLSQEISRYEEGYYDENGTYHEGVSHEEAVKRAYANAASDVVWAGIQGMLSGGLSSSVVTGIQAGSNIAVGKQVMKQGDTEALIQAGLKAPADSEAKAIADKIGKRQARGKAPTAMSLGALKGTTLDAISQKARSAVVSEEEITDRLRQVGVAERDVASFASVIAKAQDGSLSEAEGKILEQNEAVRTVAEQVLLRNAVERVTATAEFDEVKALGTEKKAESKVERSVSSKAPKYLQVSSDGVTRLTESGEAVEIADVVSVDGGEVKVKLTNGETVNVGELSFASGDEAVMYEEISSFEIHPAAMKTLLDGYDPSLGVSPTDYLRAVSHAYTFGKYRIPRAELSDMLSERQKETAYHLGEVFAEKKTAQTSEGVKANAKTETQRQGRLVIEKNVSIKNERQNTARKALALLAKRLGVTIHLYASRTLDGKKVYERADGTKIVNKNGWYDTKTGEIWLDINADLAGEGLFLFTASHELVHWIRQWSPDKFKVLADFLMAKYGEKGTSVDDLIRAQIANAEDDGRKIDYDTAYEEVVASSMEAMLKDGKVLEKLAELEKTDRGLVEKIRSFLRKFAAKLRSLYKGIEPASVEGRLIASMTKEADRLEQLFAEALHEAGENFKKTDVSEFETSGEVKYSQQQKKVEAVVDRAIKQQGNLGVKYNQVQISEFPADITAVVNAASEGRINLTGKYIAINGDDIWHEYRSHSDASKELGRRQLPQTAESIKESVMAIYAPDVVESLFTTNQNPTQRQSFAYAKKSPNGYYIVVEAVGGKKNPNVVPVMLLQFTEEKWNDMMSSGMTLGELLFENDAEKRNSLDVELNKKNRVTVAQFASKEAIANTPRSPQFNNSIPQTDLLVKSEDMQNSEKYSSGATNASSRSILVNALESAAQTKAERARLAEYKAKIAEIEAEERKLDELNRQIRELSFAKGPRDKERIRALKDEAIKTRNRIDIYDRQLLRLEAAKPLQNFVDRKRKEAEQKVKEIANRQRKESEGDKEINPYAGKTLYDTGEVYDYTFMTSLDPMRVETMPPLSSVKESDKVSQEKAISLGLQNAKSVGREIAPSRYAIKNAYTKREIILGKNGLNHSLDASNIHRLRTNARLSAIGGSIVQNAVPINGLQKKNRQAIGTYAMACLVNDGNGYVVAIVTVDEFSSHVVDLDFSEITHSINGRFLAKQEDSRSSTRELELGQKSISTTAISEISIADFLEIVNATHRSILSEDVLRHFDEIRPENGYYSNQVLFSDRGGEDVSTRGILVNALESAALDEKELSLLRRYKAKIAEIEAEERKLDELNRQIRELSFAKGPRDKERIRALKDEAIKTRNRIDIYDRQLLRLEAAKPLQDFVDRARKKAENEVREKANRQRKEAEESYSNRDYSYEALTSKPDMTLTVLDDSVPESRAEVIAEGKKNAASVGQVKKDGSVSVYVEDIGSDVILSAGGLRHSLDRRTEVNAPVVMKAGEILQNSIRINEMIPQHPNASGSYVLVGIAQNTTGELYIVRSVVNSFKSELVSMDILYAINAKTEPDLKIKENRAGAYPQGFADGSAILTGSKISVAQLLEFVNNYFPDVLPESVLRYFGHSERPDGKLGASVLFSDRGGEDVSTRGILVNALESAALDEKELSLLRRYKAKIAEIEAEERNLDELNRQIRELSFAKGPRDKERIRALKDEAIKTRNRIDIYDRQLLRLEAAKPLKDFVERKRKEAEQKVKEIAKRQRKEAEERRKKTVVRQRIRHAAKELDRLLNHGTKEKNVKKGIQAVVRNAVDLADVMFLTNETMVQNGIITSKTEEEKEQLLRYQALLDELHATDDDVSVNKERRKELRQEIRSLDRALAGLLERERVRIHSLRGVEITEALAREYQKLKDDTDDFMAAAYDSDVYDRIASLGEFFGDTLVKDMSLEQLEQVYEAFVMIKHKIRALDRIFRRGKSEEMRERVRRVQSELEEFAKRESDPGTMGGKLSHALRSFSWNELRPMDAFHRLGSEALEELYWDAVYAQDDYARLALEAKQTLTAARDRYGYTKWRMREADRFIVSSGKELSLTLAEKLSLYATCKREQGYHHITTGGFVFGEGMTYRENGQQREHRTTEAYRLEDADIEAIVGTLTEEQRAYADTMVAFMTSLGDQGNEVSRALYGIDLFTEEYYFPIQVSKDSLPFSQRKNGDAEAFTLLKNTGMTKPTVKGAAQTVVLRAFDDVMIEHVDIMAKYCAYVLPIENLQKVFGQASQAFSDSHLSTQTMIRERFGKEAVDYVKQYLRDLNGTVSRSEGGLSRLFTRSKGMMVLMNFSVWAQQFFSVTRACAELDVKYFLPFFRGEAVKSDNSVWKEMQRYAPVAVLKDMGRFDIGSDSTLKNYIAYEGAAFGKEKLIKTLGDAASFVPNRADRLAWEMIYKAAKREIADTTDLRVGSEEFLREVGRRFTEVVTKTQVYDSVNTRSGYMRSENGFIRFSTTFMGEPTTLYGMAFCAALDFKRAKQRGRNVKKAAVKLVESYLLLTFSSAILDVVRAFVYAMRDDDEDEAFLEKWAEQTGRLWSNYTDGGILLEALNLLPVGRDLVSIYEGYTAERPDLSLISDFVGSLKKLTDGEMTAEDRLEVLGTGGNLLGIPMKNMIRDVKAILNVVDDITDGVEPVDIGGAFERGLTGTELTESQALYAALRRGDMGQLKKLRAGYANEAAYESAVKKAIRENDSRVKAQVKALADGDFSGISGLVDSLVSQLGVSEEIAAEAIYGEYGYYQSKLTDGAEALDQGDKQSYQAILKTLRARYRGVFSQEEIVSAIKATAETLADAERYAEDGNMASIYRTWQVNQALDKGDTETAVVILDDLIQVKVDNYLAGAKAEAERNGMRFNEREAAKDAESKARASLKGSVTRYWKEKYQAAWRNSDAEEMTRIRKLLYATGLYGSTTAVSSTVREWLKEAVNR